MTTDRRLGALAIALLACSAKSGGELEKPDPPAGEKPAADTRARTPALDELFGPKLSAWVVQLNNTGHPDSGSVLDAAVAALPEPIGKQLAVVLAKAISARSVADDALGDVSDALDDEVARLDGLLAAADLGYQLDASVATTGSSRSVLLFSFAVVRVRSYRVGESDIRALWVSRLDELAFRYRLVGLAAENREVMILPARIDEMLVRDVLPFAASAERWKRAHDLAGSELPATVVAAINRELRPIAGDALEPLASALEARLGLIEGVRGRLAAQSIALELPSTLALDKPWRDALAAVTTPDERAKLDAIEKRLAELDVRIAFGKVRSLAIAAIEHHEIQHQLDRMSGNGSMTQVKVAETSGYLAEIARGTPGALLVVCKLAGFALSSRTPALEREVAAQILGSLSAQLGGPVDTSNAEEISVAAASILRRGPDEIASAASRAWRAEFGVPLAELQLAGAGSQAAP